jgi:hypothetical protein
MTEFCNMGMTLRVDWKGPSFKFWHTYKWFDLQRAVSSLTQLSVMHNVVTGAHAIIKGTNQNNTAD